MDESQPQIAFQLAGMGIGFVKGLAKQYHLAAYCLGLHDLNRRRGARHDDRGGHAQARRVIRQALGMVAGRCRDHTAIVLRSAEQQQGIESAALLVGRRKLKVLELQPDLGPGNVAQRLGMIDVSPHDRTGNARGGSADIVDGQKGGIGIGRKQAGHDARAVTETCPPCKPRRAKKCARPVKPRLLAN